MIKNSFKRKIVKILTISAFALCMGTPSIVSASTNDVVQVEKEVVTNYLSAIKSLDFDKAVELAKDNRVSSEEYKLNLKEMVSNPNNQIKSFEILDKFDKQENNTTLYVRLEYLNGHIEECPVRLEKYNEEYIIVRTDANTTEIKKVYKFQLDSQELN